MRHALGLTGFLILTVATPVCAKSWLVDSSKSHLTFIGTQGATHFDGSFAGFHPTIDLDPAAPETGKIMATIDIGSITAGSTERDSYLPQVDWFNTKAFPSAQFLSTSIQKTGEHDYVAQGNLTIKNITQPVTLPFTLMQEGDHWRAQGKVTLNRADFHIGEGDWSGETYVKHAVDVVVDIVAKPSN